MRDWEGALADFNQALDLNPDDPDALRGRASVQFKRKEYESAVADATRAIELNDKDYKSYQIRGFARTSLKDFPSALSDLDEAISLNSRDSETFAGRGTVRVIQGDLDGAQSDLATAIQLNPTNRMAMLSLGFIKKKRGDLEGALAAYTNAAAIGPPYPEVYVGIGHLQYDLHQDAAALQNLHKALELDPRQNYARFCIWLTRARLGEREQASRELSEQIAASSAEPNHEWELCIGRYLAGDPSESSESQFSSRKPSPRPNARAASRGRFARPGITPA